jgi:hypothetical protein
MSQNIADIVHPLIENGLFDNAESAVKDLMTDYVLRQVEHYRDIIQKLEKKHGMSYHQFNKYLEERSKKIKGNKVLQQNFMLEEDDAQDWKIATEMLNNWLGLKGKTNS